MLTNVVPFDPSQLTSKQEYNESIQGFDLVYKLNMHRGEFIGGDSIKIYRLPEETVSSLEGIRDRVSEPRLGDGPIINCCVEEGLTILENTTVIDDYKELRSRLVAGISKSYYTGRSLKFAGIIFKYLKDNPITLNDGSSLGYAGAFSMKMPDEIKSRLSGIAKGLGMKISLLIVVCLMEVLSKQEEINKEYKKRWKVALVDWRDGMEMQLEVVRKIMELVE